MNILLTGATIVAGVYLVMIVSIVAKETYKYMTSPYL
jgi:hypothetical protein